MGVYTIYTRKPGLTTLCANGKQKFLIISPVWIGNSSFAIKKAIYRKGLGRVWPDDIFQDGGDELQIESTFSKIVRSMERDLSYHLHSDRNFRNFCVNGKQRDVVIFNTLTHIVYSMQLGRTRSNIRFGKLGRLFLKTTVWHDWLKEHAREKKSAPVCYELAVICWVNYFAGAKLISIKWTLF